MTFSELKIKAKEQLMGKKKKAALALLVSGIVTGLTSTIANAIFPGKTVMQETFGTAVEVTEQSPIAAFIVSIVGVFIGLGMASYYMKVARGEDPGIDELFSKGNIFLKVLVSSYIAGVLIVLGCIALVIPGIILALAYSMIDYIYIDNPEIGIVEAITKSREMMKGHKWEYFCLCLSFIGWAILGIFTLGILYFWLAPYMGVTIVNFYDEISGKSETPVKQEEPTSEEE